MPPINAQNWAISWLLTQIFLSATNKTIVSISATPNTKNVYFFLNKKSFKLNDKAHLYHFDYINLSIFFLKNCLYNIHTSLEYWDTPYKKISYDYNIQKKLLKSFNYNKKSNEISSPGVGNIMTLVYKKMLK